MKTTKKFNDLKERIDNYNIMQQVAKDYRDAIDRIEKEEKWFHVYSIEFANRGDKEKIEVNSVWAPMHPRVIKEGLQDALAKLERIMAQEERELKEWIEP